MGLERLQKVLAQAGIASRRKCEALITAGRVKVDGKVCSELGTKVDLSKQRITVDDEVISLETKTCIMLHKPTSCVTTVTDPQGRRTVMDLIKGLNVRVYPVGRLDYETTGLLLLTNDGELAQKLLHPSLGVEKIYRATVIGMPDKASLSKLESGIRLDDGMTSPARVHVLRNHPRESVIELTIHEGRKHQVRRMFETIGFPVKRLKRVQFGPLSLTGVEPGAWRYLTRAEWKATYSAANLPEPAYQIIKPMMAKE